MKIKVSSIYAFINAIILFIFLLPNHVNLLGSIQNIAFAALYLGVCAYIIVKKRISFSWLSWALVFFVGEFLLSELVNGGSQLIQIFWNLLPILSLTMFADYQMSKNPQTFLNTLIGVLMFLATIHLFYRLLGIYTNDRFLNKIYFLGSDNQATSYLLCLFFCCVTYISLYGKTLMSIYGSAIAVFIGFFTNCGTAVITYLFIGAFFFMQSLPFIRKLYKKIINHNVIFSLYLFFTVTMFLIPMLPKDNFLIVWIKSITGKELLTFSNRTVLWMEAFVRIIGNPLFGIGYGEMGNGVWSPLYQTYAGAHHQLLQWAVNGGVLAVIIFLVILYHELKSTTRLSRLQQGYIMISLLGYLIAMSMELFFNGIHLFLMFAIIGNLPVVNEKGKEFKRIVFQIRRIRN